jgi:hypothetical protein
MRFARITSAIAFALFLGGATSLLGSWAVSTACGLAVAAAVVGAIAAEERDPVAAEALASPAFAAEPVEVRTTTDGAPDLEAA